MGPRTHSLPVVDFFCGCGGTSAGLRAAGLDIALGLDMDPKASRTYRRNFPEAAFIERDIRDISPPDVANALNGGLWPLLVSACAPCQPYSTLASTDRRHPERTLLLRLLPFLDELKPPFVLVENVPGLKSHHAPAGTFARFCKALRSRGFHISIAIVDCQDFGVPQRRRRLVIMGSRLAPITIPRPSHGRRAGRLPPSTVAEWISHFPPVNAGERHAQVPNHQASALTELNLRRLQATPEGGGRANWPEDLWLACHSGHDGHSDVYGRMRWDAPAPVLTTKCTSISNGRFGHPSQDRPISVREAAALQTFPDDFVFEGGIKSETRQVGNAVPVLLAQRLGEAFLQHLRDYGPFETTSTPNPPSGIAPAL